MIVQSTLIWANYLLANSPHCIIYLWWETERGNWSWSLLGVNILFMCTLFVCPIPYLLKAACCLYLFLHSLRVLDMYCTCHLNYSLQTESKVFSVIFLLFLYFQFRELLELCASLHKNTNIPPQVSYPLFSTVKSLIGKVSYSFLSPSLLSAMLVSGLIWSAVLQIKLLQTFLLFTFQGVLSSICTSV